MARGLVAPRGHRGLVDDNGTGGAGGASITIDSPDGSIDIDEPTPGNFDLTVNPATAKVEELIAQTRYGTGNPAQSDDGIPIDAETATEFYLAPSVDQDHAIQAGDVTLFPVRRDTVGLRMVIWIDRLQMPSTDAEDCTLALTIMVLRPDESILETLVENIVGTVIENEYIDVQTVIDVPVGSALGVRAAFSENLDSGGLMRMTVNVYGTPGTIVPPPDPEPFIDDRLTLWLEADDDFTSPIVVSGDDENEIDILPNRAPLTGSANDAGPYPHPGAHTAGDKALLLSAVVNGHNAIEMAPGRYLCNDNALILEETTVFDQPRHSFHLVVPRAASDGGPLGTYEVGSPSHGLWQAPHLEYSAGTLYIWSVKGFLIGTVDVSATPAVDYLNQLVIVEDIVKEDGSAEFRVNGTVVTPTAGAPGDIGLPTAFLGYGVGCFLDLSLAASAASMLFIGRLTYKGPTELSPEERQQTYDYLEDKYGPLGAI